MTIGRRTLGAGLAGGAALTAMAGAAQAQNVQLRYSNASNDQNTANVFAASLFKRIEERTNGQVKTQLLLNAGSEQSILEGVSLGTLDMAVTGYSGLREFDVFYTPYLLRDIPHGVRVFKTPIGERAAKAMADRYKIRLLGVGATGPFLVATKNKVGSWAELKGMKIRVPPFESYAEAVRVMGGVPTPVPFNEVYLALQQGVVDALITNLNVMVVNKFLEVCKHVITNDFGVGLDKFTISDRAWNRLSPQQREAVAGSFNEMQGPVWVEVALNSAKKDFETWRQRNGADSVLTLDGAELERMLRPLGEKSVSEIYGAGAYETISKA